jgi:hypothetical protein
MMSSGLALHRLHIPMDYGVFRYFAFMRVIYSFERQYSYNNYTLFVTFDITVNNFVCMSRINIPRDTCDEYLVLE